MEDQTLIHTHETTWTVDEIIENYQRPDQEINPIRNTFIPDCQRNWAWSNKNGKAKMELFIDSVIMGYPIPSFILNKLNSRYHDLYDGRHRMETISRYANNEFPWKGKYFKDLSKEEENRFLRREIPVTLVRNATRDQLAEIFIRLNQGVALKDYDYLWANRHRNLIKAVEKYIYTQERLSKALGEIDLRYRNDLANWAAIVRGLHKQDAGYMTTSYLRLSDENGLDEQVNEKNVKEGINALITLLETANTEYETSDKEKKTLKKVGKVIGFFFHEWLTSDKNPSIITKWVKIIGKLRGADKDAVSNALKTSGAQNLNLKKIEKVISQLNTYLNNGTQKDNDSICYEEDDE